MVDLIISNNHISDTVVGVFINITLQKLNLSHKNISDHGLLFIYDCLKINITLCELDFCRNNITNKVAKIFAEANQVNTTLQYKHIKKLDQQRRSNMYSGSLYNKQNTIKTSMHK